MINKKFVVCTTVKNNAYSLQKTFKLISEIFKNTKECFVIFVYTKSNDNTKSLILNFIKEKKGKVITCNPKNSLNRVKKLEICRNQYLSFIKKNKSLKKYDYLLVMDADGVNNLLTFNKIQNSLKKKNWSGIFANQQIFYYDIFALRIKNYLEENFLFLIKKELSKKNFRNLKKILYNNFTRYFYVNKHFAQKRFIRVNSAFGGFGIYKMYYVLKSNYKSFNGKICEHVFLNEKISKQKNPLYIDKQLVNGYGINIHTLNGLLCSKFNFFAKRFLKKVKLIK